MKLMTEALEQRFLQVGCQEGVKDPIMISHFFNPGRNGDWYATEYDPKSRMIFGYARIFYDGNDEWGYTSLEELEAIRNPLGIERDLYWEEKRASEVIPGFQGFSS